MRDIIGEEKQRHGTEKGNAYCNSLDVEQWFFSGPGTSTINII